MPIITRGSYGERLLVNGSGYMEITPTIQAFVEADGTDVRLDRVRIYTNDGTFVRAYLQDKMGRRFVDNLPNTEDYLLYLETLPTKERK